MSGNHERPPKRPGGERPRDDEDLVERLVRLADAGPAPAAEETARLKQRLRPLWRDEVRARSRRLLLWTAGGLAAAAALVIVVGRTLQIASPVPPALPAVATVVTIVGRADVTPLSGVREVWGAEAAGTPLPAGALLDSGTARLALRLAGGQSLRLDAASRVQLDAPGSITLAAGAVYLDSAAGGDGVVVRTVLGDARDIGTQFEVRLAADSLTVKVREGAVLVGGAGDRLTVEAGTAVTLAPGRAPERHELASWAAEWEWTQAVAAPLDIEGRRASEFVAWAARESGFRVSYADARAERRAREAVLHGTLLGPTPLDSLSAVLPGCGLRFTRSEGQIVVSAGTVPHR
jgi:ferric-dicitrate binding protein FerR (iron transport regulator)